MENPSELNGTRVALAFAYEGPAFDSFARQPGKRTVEGELVEALRRERILDDPSKASWEVASRTDRGVSAAWNVCAFDTDAHPGAAAHVKDLPPGLFVLAGAHVPSGFSVRRSAARRVYSYALDDAEGLDAEKVRAACRRVQGRHDFRNFCRREEGVDPRREVTRVRFLKAGGTVLLRFEAPSFLWEQVRRLVHAIVGVGRGEKPLAALEAQLQGAAEVEPPAAPEPLLLEKVDVPVEFAEPSVSTRERVDEARRGAWARRRFYDSLAASLPTARR